MEWKNPQDRVSILQSISTKRDQETVELVEQIAKFVNAGGSVENFEPETIYHPDQLANALLLLVSHFDKGREFFESLSWIGRQIVIFQSALVNEHQRKAAATASHRGEADEIYSS